MVGTRRNNNPVGQLLFNMGSFDSNSDVLEQELLDKILLYMSV